MTYHKWTEVEKEIVKNRYSKGGSAAVNDELYTRFGYHCSKASIRHIATRLGVKLGVMQIDGMNVTVRGADHWITLNGEPVKLQRYLYAKHCGAIPESYLVEFKDFDKSIFEISNLICITKRESLKRRQPEGCNKPYDNRYLYLDQRGISPGNALAMGF